MLIFCSYAWLFFALSAHAALIPTSASDSFPQCAVDCSVLQQAQDSCTTGPQSSWASCFCESALLTSLKSSGSLCTSCTAPADQSLLSSWYNSYCRSGGDGNTNKAADNTATTATTTTSAPTAGATNTASSANSNNTTVTEEHPSWWSTHYKWVIMLIVLAVAFSFIAALGVWLKRRHDARHAQLYRQPATSTSVGGLSAPPGTYAPPAAAQSQSRSLAPDSVASSSRTDVVAPKGVAPPSRSRLHKTTQSAAADVEIRQVSRP